MATVDPAPKSPFSSRTDKTIFSLLSNINQTEIRSKGDTVKSDSLNSDDLVILRRDPTTNQNTINKPAYLKLHTSLSPNRNSSIEKIKENFEQSGEIIQPKVELRPSSVPVPKSRRSKLTRSQVIITAKREPKKVRYSLNIEKNKDVNSNHLTNSDENLSSDEEYVTIVRRSDSEESISKIKEELSFFTLDTNMEKKNKTGFRKIFSVFRNKDKKKRSEDNNKLQNKDNAGMYSDNYQNESNTFSRHSNFRHTTGGENHSTKAQSTTKVQRSDSDVKVANPYLDQQIEREYAQKHIDQFNKYKESFENVSSQNSSVGNRERYTPMDKPIAKNNNTNNGYMNLPGVRKYIDSSSSASTLDSDKSNPYANDGQLQPNQRSNDNIEENKELSTFIPNRVIDGKRDTPPRLLETKQDVRLVNPKALIPINSERALPNPYQNVYPRSPINSSPQNVLKPITNNAYKTMHSPKEIPKRPNLNETYGTVFDSLEDRTRYITAATRTSPREQEKVPRSLSLEPSKLKLPPNREIVPLSPRVRSPIPFDNVSTEKIIATELLKIKGSPTPTKKGHRDFSQSHQRLEIDIDYPDNIQNVSKEVLLTSTDNISAKPPIGTNKQQFKASQENGRTGNDNYRFNQVSPSNAEIVYRRSQASPMGSDKIITNAQVHINSPVNRTPTPNNSMQNLSLSPVKPPNGTARPSTPLELKMHESPKTPQKEDMRKSVEAYYWKEIKKLKDQENYDLYLLQMRYGNMYPYEYVEEPANVRRSRSLSPSANRNSRRSLSLPRDVKGQMGTVPEKRYYPNPIPENQAVNYQIHPKSIQQLQFQQQLQQKYFNRNAPERRTIDGSSPKKYDNNTNSLYRPIFKRGSLNTPTQQNLDDSLKRKVSFSGASDQNVQSWPTKNGFTKSPPQRRIPDRSQSQVDDDVFVPNTQTISNDNRYQYQTNSRIDPLNEEMYYNTKQNQIRSNGETFYISKSNLNPQYMPQKQIAESPYSQRIPQLEEGLYGQPRDVILPPTPTPRLVRHGSIQIAEELYMQRPGQRRISYQNNNFLRRPSITSTPNPNQEVQFVARTSQPPQLRREIILNDEIFGQFGGYVPNHDVRGSQPQSIYSSRQSVSEYPQARPTQRQVSVNNKVCDFYGQIHDTDAQRVQQTGVIMGQLHRNPGSPMVIRNSYSQLPGREPFIRNSRLTASANDMYHRSQQNAQYPTEQLYGRIESQMNENDVFNRPLPPVPQGKKVISRNLLSDTENTSNISEGQRIMNTNRNRGIYGK